MKNFTFILTLCSSLSLFCQNGPIALNAEPYVKSTVISHALISEDNFLFNCRLSREFSLNPLLKNEATISRGDEVALDLFSDKNYTAKVETVIRDVNNTLVVLASINNFPGAFCIITTSTDGISSLKVEIPQLAENYISVFYPATRLQYLVLLDKERGAGFKCESINIDLGHESFQDAYSYSDNDLNSVAEIDMMVVYTPAAEAYAIANNGGMNNVIANFMAATQTVMDNSLVDVHINLVYSQLINYTESGSYSTDLVRLQDPVDGIMDEVHQWRRYYQADLVIFVIMNQDVGGSAYLLNDPAGQPNYAFGLVTLPSIAIDVTIPAHEIGHNMGCHHHKLQNTEPGPGLFSYSAGWRWTDINNNQYCSIMTYESGQYFDDGIGHSRVPHFSNPDVAFEGTLTGDFIDGNNANSIRQIKHVIAAYSDLLEITNFGLENISLSPNPTSGIVEIFTPTLINLVTIFDTQGKLLETSASSQLNLENYDKGLYLVRVETDKGATVKKIVKE